MKDLMIISGTWVALILGFWLTASTAPFYLSLPVVGLLWTGLPLLLTGRSGPVLAVVSIATFAVVAAAFLGAAWFALVLMGGIGNILFDLDASYAGAASHLGGAGLAGLAGAVTGAIVGRSLRTAGRSTDGTA